MVFVSTGKAYSYDDADTSSDSDDDVLRRYHQTMQRSQSVHSYSQKSQTSNMKGNNGGAWGKTIAFFFKLTSHVLTRGPDCQKRSRTGLCSKLPDMRSVGDIVLNPSLRKSKRE